MPDLDAAAQLAAALGVPADPRDLDAAGREHLDAITADTRAGLAAAHEHLRETRARMAGEGGQLPVGHPLLRARDDARATITRYRELRDALDAYRQAAP